MTRRRTAVPTRVLGLQIVLATVIVVILEFIVVIVLKDDLTLEILDIRAIFVIGALGHSDVDLAIVIVLVVEHDLVVIIDRLVEIVVVNILFQLVLIIDQVRVGSHGRGHGGCLPGRPRLDALRLDRRRDIQLGAAFRADDRLPRQVVESGPAARACSLHAPFSFRHQYLHFTVVIPKRERQCHRTKADVKKDLVPSGHYPGGCLCECERFACGIAGLSLVFVVREAYRKWGNLVLYHAYELTHAAMGPMRTAARVSSHALRNPFFPFAASLPARATAAACDMFVNATRRYGKPEFGITEVEIAGELVPVTEEVVLNKPFCDLLHFKRNSILARARNDPKLLIVAPMSGHFATLLRGTVEAMLPEHDVYITDWADARDVSLSEGSFDLADYADYICEFSRLLAAEGERVAIMAVCQPGVPCMASASFMAEDGDPARPASLILMGSPIDTRINETEPNSLAQTRPLSWFEKNVIVTVPWPNRGFLRRVYPGFLQLSGFMSMNLDRHVDAHLDQFHHLIRGDGDSAAAHQAFYDEYLAVMDLTAEFYLETVEKVFQNHDLPKGSLKLNDRRVQLDAIRDTAVMTIEGELDDITGRGQTEAALELCTSLPKAKKLPYVQAKVGHYGVFNGSRFRRYIQPKMRDFIRANRTMVRG